MATLALIDEQSIKNRYLIEKDTVTVGRRTDNDILIPNMMVSGHHAEIRKIEQKYYLADLQSTNGTLVNGVRIDDKTEIHHYDHIVLGNVEFVFLIDDNARVNIDQIRSSPTASIATAQTKPDETGFSNRIKPETLMELIKVIRTKMIAKYHADDPVTLDQLTELEHSVGTLGTQLKEYERSQERLNTLYEVGKVINLILEPDELLNTIIDLALKVMNADSGFIMLYDEQRQLIPKISRRIQTDELKSGSTTFSTTIARTVAESGESILTSDAEKDARFQDGASIITHHIRSVICSPLKNKDQVVIGVLYVGSNVTSNVFSKSDVELLEAFSNHAAIAIENAKLYEEKRRKEHLKSALERYVSKQIAEMIMSKDVSGDIRFAPEKKEVTILFSDIRGFTPLSEALSPEEIVDILNRYFSRMIQIIFKYNGTLDKFLGDSIMALFGAPTASGEDAVSAIRTAIEMQQTLKAFNEEQRSLGKPEIEVGIGIATGPVVVGNIGSDQRMEYTAIGDRVNLSSRLQGKAGGHQILVCSRTYEKAKNHIQAKKLEPIMVKGKSMPIEVYEIIY